jgi:hypothetical protein
MYAALCISNVSVRGSRGWAGTKERRNQSLIPTRLHQHQRPKTQPGLGFRPKFRGASGPAFRKEGRSKPRITKERKGCRWHMGWY